MPLIKRVWRVVRWPLVVLLILFVGVVIYRIPHAIEQQKTQEAVERIHAARLTMGDVDGSNLPPTPDAGLVDATVEGVDANDNGIRDDVELAIFKKYPGSANLKIRAAELQYAKALQMYLGNNVFNQDTWKAIVFEDSRGSVCVSKTYPRNNLSEYFKVVEQRTSEVESMVFNTEPRKDAHQKVSSFTTSVKLADADFCDLQP